MQDQEHRSAFDPSAYSTREREVMAGIARGASVKQIADELNITSNTVKDYTKTIYSKAQVHSARELLIQIYGASRGPSGQCRGRELVAIFEALLVAEHPMKLLPDLRRGAMECTGATGSSLWRIAGIDSRLCIGAVNARSVSPVVSDGFIAGLLTGGVLITGSIERSLHQEQADTGEILTYGLARPDEVVLGMTLAPVWSPWCQLRTDMGAGPTILLLTRPRSLGFTEGDASLCRLMVRVAETHLARITNGPSVGSVMLRAESASA